MRLFQTQKFVSVVIIYTKNTLSGIAACSITPFTPTFQYFYTDISAISVTFRNSAGDGPIMKWVTSGFEQQWAHLCQSHPNYLLCFFLVQSGQESLS